MKHTIPLYPKAITICLLIAFASGPPSVALAVVDEAVPAGTKHPGFVGYVPNVIVVEFDEGIFEKFNPAELTNGRTGNRKLDKLFRRYKAGRIRKQFPGARPRWYRGRRLNLARWHKIQFKRNVDVARVTAAIKMLDGVIDAQPVGIHRVHHIPNDPDFDDQWHLDQPNDADIDAPEAWEHETGNEEIIAAVLDTGVRYYHKDLGGSNASSINPLGADGNMWINWEEKDGTPGVDDDGNVFDGNVFVDDWIGWDFVDGATSCWTGEDCDDMDNDPRDFNGHGTHVSGIIAALNNNGYKTASSAGGGGNGSLQSPGSGVKIMALRIGWSDRYYDRKKRKYVYPGYVRMDFAAQAFYYAADNGAHFVNCSWNSTNSGGLEAAVDYFFSKGGLVFKSAGNGNSEQQDYLTSRSDVIRVAATNQSDCKASFSSYGTWVDISAPGQDILSSYDNPADSSDSDRSETLSGTSMSSPLALSVAALIWSKHPSWSADMVKRQLFNTADAIEGLSCNASYTGKLGAGRVNAYNAVGPCAGDLNNNGTVDGSDLAGLIAGFNSGQADGIDLEIFSDYFGRNGCPLR